MNPDESCACTALRKASRAVTRIYDDALAGRGMTITQFSVLRNVRRSGPLPLSRLAEVLVMERTTIYRIIGPLLDYGLLAVTSGRGKAKIVAVTEAGREALDAASGDWQLAQSSLIGRIGAGEWAVIEAALDNLTSIATGSAR